MSREIEIRAWDPDQKKFLYAGEFEIYNEEDNGVHSGRECKATGWVSYDLEHYILRRDKNGNKIWVGDIITANIIEFGVKMRGNVVFDKEHSCYACKNLAGLTPLYKLDRIEVVENIHENQDLLQEGG